MNTRTNTYRRIPLDAFCRTGPAGEKFAAGSWWIDRGHTGSAGRSTVGWTKLNFHRPVYPLANGFDKFKRQFPQHRHFAQIRLADHKRVSVAVFTRGNRPPRNQRRKPAVAAIKTLGISGLTPPRFRKRRHKHVLTPLPKRYADAESPGRMTNRRTGSQTRKASGAARLLTVSSSSVNKLAKAINSPT